MAINKNFSSCLDKENWLVYTPFQEYVTTVLTELSKAYPNVKTELYYKNPYTFLIAVLLSAQATDKSVNKVTEKLFDIADNPQAMLELGLDKLKTYIKTIGLYNAKSGYIINISQDLVNEYNSKVPLNRDILETFPGIGRKSANVIMNTLCNAPYIAVDTHVMRLAHRLNLVSQKVKTPLAIENELYKNVPKNFHIKVSNLLVMHGRYVCKAIKPKCRVCPIRKICPIT